MRRWLLPAALVVALAIGITGGVALAQGNGQAGDSLGKSFISRVARILGLDEAKVQDAFKQAGREIEDEAVQQRLSGLVESGKLTQVQADEYLKWYKSRPEGPLTAPGFGQFGAHGFKPGGEGVGPGPRGPFRFGPGGPGPGFHEDRPPQKTPLPTGI